MLKKALTVATLAVAVTDAAGTVSPVAVASDTSGGDYPQNTNLIPHPCLDVKRKGKRSGSGQDARSQPFGPLPRPAGTYCAGRAHARGLGATASGAEYCGAGH